jgi:hypothetical protein
MEGQTKGAFACVTACRLERAETAAAVAESAAMAVATTEASSIGVIVVREADVYPAECRHLAHQVCKWPLAVVGQEVGDHCCLDLARCLADPQHPPSHDAIHRIGKLPDVAASIVAARAA